MKALFSLFAAFANLAASINAMAATVTMANDRLREQLDYQPTSPQLDHEVIIENGDGKRRTAKAR